MNSVIYPRYAKVIETCLNVPENHVRTLLHRLMSHITLTTQMSGIYGNISKPCFQAAQHTAIYLFGNPILHGHLSVFAYDIVSSI